MASTPQALKNSRIHNILLLNHNSQVHSVVRATSRTLEREPSSHDRFIPFPWKFTLTIYGPTPANPSNVMFSVIMSWGMSAYRHILPPLVLA